MSPRAWPHATEQPFVLLLPTGFYMSAGVMAVVLTLALLAIPQIGDLTKRWNAFSLAFPWCDSAPTLHVWTSCLSFILLLVLVLIGWLGPTDPAKNLLPLFVWALWWIVLLLVQALICDFWRLLNPWTGPCYLLRCLGIRKSAIRLPAWLGPLPALVLFLIFAIFLTADLAPSDPRRLAMIVSAYWLFTLAAMMIFGERSWLHQGEFVTVLMRRFAAISPLRMVGDRLSAGFSGWQVPRERTGIMLSLFTVALLGFGSFESLYQTFWWLSLIGINPLEFPGRSVIVWQTVLGLLGLIVLAALAFAAVVAAGLALRGETSRFRESFCRQAQCLLPIVVGYHIAHYLTALLIEGQYLYVALSDPFGLGADLFGTGGYHVSVGFLQTWDGARIVWLSQAGAVIAGHVLAILLSHAVALDMFENHRKATASQLPISVFMVLYTFFGLWLLASPRGM